MAKMFYSLEEAAGKLGLSVDQVKDLASKGQLQEFRDRDRLMFKVEQVDILAGGKEDEGGIPLADSGEMEPLSLSESGSGSALTLDSPKEQTGISIFDAEGTEQGDASAVTHVTSGPGGSGMLDLTKDGGDSAMGAKLLDDAYGSDTVASSTAAPAIDSVPGALFESGPGDAEAAAAPLLIPTGEAYDGAGSGLVGGLCVGIAVSLAVALFAGVIGMTSVAGGGIMAFFADKWMIVVGVCAGVTLIGALIGFLVGKKS